MNQKATFFFLFLMFIALGALLAQSNDEDQITMQQYKLPDNAILESSLIVRDTIAYYDNKPFNGTAYEKYANNKLKLSAQYKDGYKHGIMYVWYPDGRPQLMSYYKYGHLNGRFKGWYQFGGVIYDIVMNQGRYAGDQLIDADETRSQVDTSDNDGNSDGKDQSNGE